MRVKMNPGTSRAALAALCVALASGWLASCGSRRSDSVAPVRGADVDQDGEPKSGGPAQDELTAILRGAIERGEVKQTSVAGASWLTPQDRTRLGEFCAKHEGKRPARMAKYLIAHSISFSTAEDEPASSCRAQLEQIVRGHPGTPEAALSSVLLANYSIMDCDRKGDLEGSRRATVRVMGALAAALPVARAIDSDTEPMTVAFRRLVVGPRGGRLELWFRLDIASCAEELGEYDRAQGLYQDIVRSSPGSECARLASLGLKGLEVRRRIDRPHTQTGNALPERR